MKRIGPMVSALFVGLLFAQAALADPQSDKIKAQQDEERRKAWERDQQKAEDAKRAQAERDRSNNPQNGGWPERPPRTVDSPSNGSMQFERLADQFTRGMQYYQGEGVAKNLNAALGCFLKAAETDIRIGVITASATVRANAQYMIGYMYDHGEGAVQNPAEAASWFAKAASLGNGNAADQLGDIYFQGRSSGQIGDPNNIGSNWETAAKWYRRGAELGNTNAQLKLGRMYLKGQGVSQDYIQASSWLEKATAGGNTSAESDLARLNQNLGRGNGAEQFAIGLRYYNGDGVAKDATEAAKWFRKAAGQNNVDAQFNLGQMYEAGQGIPRDGAQAAKWYRQAAEAGNAVAQIKLGKMLAAGQGVTMDQTEAAKWFLKAAERGVAEAQFSIGDMYEHGQGVAENKTAASEWYRKAAVQGVAEAQLRTGFLCENEQPAVALEWYRKAAVQDNTAAQIALASMYEDGIGGTKQDLVEAWVWYNVAAKSGYYWAKPSIRRIELSFDETVWERADKRSMEVAAEIKAKRNR